MARKRVPLGDAGISFAPMGVGTWAWGQKAIWHYGQGYGEDDLRAAYHEALAAGVTLFDTAEIYGRGESERLLGRFMAEDREAGKRLSPIVATKFLPVYRFKPVALERALRGSMERLGVDMVDLYQIHWPLSPLSIQTWALQLLKVCEQGLCRAVGVSNYSPGQMEAARVVLGKRGVRLASNQFRYSLLCRSNEHNGLLDRCFHEGVTPLAYMPLEQGVLTGKYGPNDPPPWPRNTRYTPTILARVQPLIGVMRKAADSHGKTVGQVALNWVMQKGAVPLVGAKNVAQMRENLGALGWKLRKAEMEALDQASAEFQGVLRTYW